MRSSVMLFSISDQVKVIKGTDFVTMPEQSLNNLAAVFPDWVKDIIMLSIAMISSAIISLSKSRYSGVFVFSTWAINIALSMVMAFLIDSLALWMVPEMNIKAEMALMVITGILSKDILELAEKKGLKWITYKSGGGV